jgi:CHASE3 domain sensor protein
MFRHSKKMCTAKKVGLGLAIGAAAGAIGGVALYSSNRKISKGTKKVLHTLENVVDNVKGYF